MSEERAGQVIHVLLLEDNVSDAKCLQQLLTYGSADFRVKWIERLDSTLETLEACAPVDIILANGTLLDVSTFLELQSKRADLPVLVLSKGGDSPALCFLSEGAGYLLSKWNLDSRGLERAIRQALLGKEARNLLKDREHPYALALEAAREGMWNWDLSNNQVSFSEVSTEILDWDAGMLDRVPTDWPSMVHPEDVRKLRHSVLLHLKGRSEHLTLEFRTCNRDGSYRWIHARGKALGAVDGRPSRLTGAFADITDRKEKEEKLAFTAFHDALTGLANRNLFMDRLAQAGVQAERRAGVYAVLFLDLDGFKRVNDSLGHAVGDRLLMAVGDRLQCLLRRGDTLARFGGDEFAIILGHCQSTPDVFSVADRVLENLGLPFRVNGHEVLTSASIGVALGSPGSEPEEILSYADIAMYRAKAGGKACYEIYRQGGQPEDEVHLSDLQLALSRDQFLVHFQPVIEINSGHLHSLEALIRWRHPARGVLRPADFLALTETTELSPRIGNWVLRQACSQVVKWRKFSPEVAVSVNLSSRQLQTPAFVTGVERIMADVGAPSQSLILEVSETLLAGDPVGIGKKLQELSNLGVRVLIDGLGSNGSSVSGLQLVPCESVKIDRSVVAGVLVDPYSRQKMEGMVTLARRMQTRVVAEGVENEQQLQEVSRMGCDLAQGFWFSPPLHPTAALALVRSRSRNGRG